MPNRYKSPATIIPLDEAVGKVLAHDITEIRPGQFKGTAFRKGCIIREDDLAHLRRLGKEHLFVLNIGKNEIHEDEAAIMLAEALAGQSVVFDNQPSEGKIALKSSHRGLLKVNVKALMKFNLIPDVICSSRHNNSMVNEGDVIAATRAIPLIIDETLIKKAVKIARDTGGIFSVKRLIQPETGLIVTGNEV